MTTKDYQTRSPLRIFLSYFKPHRRLFALDLSCAFLIACIDLAFPLVSRAAMYTWLPQRQFRVFFIVMAVVVAAADADAVAARLQAEGETVYRIGRIDARRDGEAQTIVG